MGCNVGHVHGGHFTPSLLDLFKIAWLMGHYINYIMEFYCLAHWGLYGVIKNHTSREAYPPTSTS